MKQFFLHNFLRFLILFSSLIFSKRVSEKGQECFIPFTYNSQIYSDCVFSKEYKKEWCFLDQTYTSWGFCKPLPKNESQFLIKNLLKDKKTYFCLFQNSNNTNLFSIDCLQGINNVDKMLWLWDSQTNEILTNDLSKSLCVFNFTFSLCENSIIKKKNHWFLDEFGRILNEETGFCLVLSEKEEKIGDFPMRKINLGRCEGFDYDSRENWIKSLYTAQDFKNMKLKNELKRWKNNSNTIIELFKKNQDLKIKLNNELQEQILLNSKLKGLSESYLEIKRIMTNFENKNLEIKKKSFDANVLGVSLQYFDNFANENTDFLKNSNYLLSNISVSQSIFEIIRKKHDNKPFRISLNTFFQPVKTEKYIFQASFLNGGFRMKINNKWFLDAWTYNEGKKIIKKDDSVELNSNRFYEIYIEYFSANPFAESYFSLSYQIEGLSEEFFEIPEKCLILPEKTLEHQNFKIFYQKNTSVIDFFPITSNHEIIDLRNLSSLYFEESYYLACPPEYNKNITNNCKELFEKGKIPPKGGLIHFDKNQSFFLPNSNQLLISMGYISTIKFSKSSLQGFESFPQNEKFAVFYKKFQYPFEGSYIDEMQLKCGEINYKLLENDFLMNNDIEHGFQIYYKPKNFNQLTLTSYYTHIYLEISSEDETNQEFVRADSLLRNPKWNKLQCFNKRDFLNIKLYYKQEIISKKNWETPITPNIFLTCSQKLSDILATFSSFLSKSEIIGFCPQNCWRTHNNFKNEVFGETVYSGNSSVCAAAMNYGLINDFYSGLIKISWYSNAPISPLKDYKDTFFIFEPLIGKVSKDPFLISLNMEIIKNEGTQSYFKSFLEVSDRNKVELTNIPNEVLSRISETMNQNSKEIIKQNRNIEELIKENEALSKKIEELEKGENGIKHLTTVITSFEESITHLKEDMNLVIENQQNTNELYQQKIEKSQKRTLSSFDRVKNSSQFIEDFDQPLSYKWQITDPNEILGGPSSWNYVNNSRISNISLLSQTNTDFQSKSVIFGSHLINNLRIFNLDFSLFIKVFFESEGMSSIIFNYYDIGNFDQLLLMKSETNSELSYQKIRKGKLKEKHSKAICEKNSPDLNYCVLLKFNEWHQINIIIYQRELIIQINEFQLDHFTQDEAILETKEAYSLFGLGFFLGKGLYFSDIEFSVINFPQKAKKTIFGDLKTNNNKIFKNSNVLGFRFKENEEKNNNGESIENIKLTCMSFQGSEESCTQAMIAYDELVSLKKHQEIEEEEISRIVYKKCINFEGNSPLGCSFAYKKALEIFRKSR